MQSGLEYDCNQQTLLGIDARFLIDFNAFQNYMN